VYAAAKSGLADAYPRFDHRPLRGRDSIAVIVALEGKKERPKFALLLHRGRVPGAQTPDRVEIPRRAPIPGRRVDRVARVATKRENGTDVRIEHRRGRLDLDRNAAAQPKDERADGHTVHGLGSVAA
jgi:hypothetical protein